jgi:TonB family protein
MMLASATVVSAMKHRYAEVDSRHEPPTDTRRKAASPPEVGQSKVANPEDPTSVDIPSSGETEGEVDDRTKRVCRAEVADSPSPYFADTVLIRLPKNVTEESFVEFTPTFARLSTAVESVSCIAGAPGGMISYMAMTFFEDDETRDLVDLRDATLVVMGYAGARFSNETRDEELRSYQVVVEVPGTADKPEPGRALFKMSAANGIMYAIVFESHPDAWNALSDTFLASAASMTFSRGRISSEPSKRAAAKARLPSVNVVEGKPDVNGAMDGEIIRRIVAAHVKENWACYNAGLVRDPRLEGSVAINFVITGDGRVGSSVVQSSSLSDSSVANCIAKAIKRWQFPKPRGGGNVIVTIPFNLELD